MCWQNQSGNTSIKVLPVVQEIGTTVFENNNISAVCHETDRTIFIILDQDNKAVISVGRL